MMWYDALMKDIKRKVNVTRSHFSSQMGPFVIAFKYELILTLNSLMSTAVKLKQFGLAVISYNLYNLKKQSH